MSQQKALSKIRQLCIAGHQPHILIPKILEYLHGCVSSYTNVFAWVDDKREIDHIYSENSELYSSLPAYHEQIISQRAETVFGGLASVMKFRNTLSTDDIWKVDRRTFCRHSFYNEVFRPAGVHVALCRTLRVADEPEGSMMLFRAVEDPEYTPEDARTVDKVARHLEYALNISRDTRKATAEQLPIRTEYITLDANGQLMNMSMGAEQVLMMLESEREQNQLNNRTELLNQKFTRIAQNLLNWREGIDTGSPTLIIENRWGKFKINAFFMYPIASEDHTPLISMQIEHFLPKDILLLDRLDKIDLTSRQREICVLIGMDLPYEQIAKELGVAKSTVVTHKKEIFDRLNIETRHELLGKVLYH